LPVDRKIKFDRLTGRSLVRPPFPPARV